MNESLYKCDNRTHVDALSVAVRMQRVPEEPGTFVTDCWIQLRAIQARAMHNQCGGSHPEPLNEPNSPSQLNLPPTVRTTHTFSEQQEIKEKLFRVSAVQNVFNHRIIAVGIKEFMAAKFHLYNHLNQPNSPLKSYGDLIYFE
jgi:hypothetical protein